MKLFLIIALSIVGVLIVLQYFTYRNSSRTEKHSYKIIKKFQHFEIRTYEPAVFSYVEMPQANYSSNASRGFRKLAGYIFGGNKSKSSIAMTSPVVMTLEDSMKMKFMVPKGIAQEKLPEPSDPDIQFENQAAKTVAAIQFSGWANDKKIKHYTEKLRTLLEQNTITYSGPFSYLGYNPPYQLVLRKNEIIVEVQWPPNS